MLSIVLCFYVDADYSVWVVKILEYFWPRGLQRSESRYVKRAHKGGRKVRNLANRHVKGVRRNAEE